MKKSLFFIFLISLFLIVQPVSADTTIEAGDLIISLDPVTGALIVTNDGIPTDEFADSIFLDSSGAITLSAGTTINATSLNIISPATNITVNSSINAGTGTISLNAGGSISLVNSGSTSTLDTITLSSDSTIIGSGTLSLTNSWTGINISSDGLIIDPSSTGSLPDLQTGTITFVSTNDYGVVGSWDGTIVEPLSSSNGAYGAVTVTTYGATQPIAPEPISSILFLIGGAFLVGRRFFKSN